MLVLSRKIGERITIAGNVEIIVSQILGNRVRLAVNAPRDVSITRYEARKENCSTGRVPSSPSPPLHAVSPRQVSRS